MMMINLVLVNTTGPDLSSKKKSNIIAFHFVQEGTAKDKWRTAYVKSGENTSDILTKCLLLSDERRQKLSDRIFRYLYTEQAA